MEGRWNSGRGRWGINRLLGFANYFVFREELNIMDDGMLKLMVGDERVVGWGREEGAGGSFLA